MLNQSSEIILTKLKAALEADSDFPTRAQLVTELRKLTSDINTPVDKIVELVMCEPSLASRLLHLTNSVYFGRGVEISTLSQAVYQLGLKGIYNLCANFVLLQKFSNLTEKSTAFANCFIVSLMTSNIAAFIDSKNPKAKDEEGYLAGSLFSLGPLLLGYYFPKTFTEAEKRAERKNIGIYQAVEELLGIPACEISLKIIDTLNVPDLYREILEGAFQQYKNIPSTKQQKASRSVCLGTLVSEAIIETRTALDLKRRIESISNKFSFDYNELLECLIRLPNIIHSQKTLLNSPSCNFPDHFVKYIKADFVEDEQLGSVDDTLSPYFSQIETAIVESETIPSIIATAMEALSFACNFKRVVYLESDIAKTKLQGKIGLGDNIPDVSSITRLLTDKNLGSEDIEIKAYYSGMVETFGKPLLDNSWPYVAIPVGYEERALGVIYADGLASESDMPVDKTITLTLLSDLLDSAIQKSRV